MQILVRAPFEFEIQPKPNDHFIIQHQQIVAANIAVSHFYVLNFFLVFTYESP